MTRIFTIITIIAAAAFALAAQNPSGMYMEMAGRADSLMQAGKWAEAADTYVSAMRAEPANGLNPLLMCNLGLCLNEKGDVNGAIEVLSDARRMLPGSSTAALNRALVFRAAGLYDEAYADLTDALAIDSTLVEPRLIRGMIALQANRLDSADVDFRRLSALPGEEARVAAATGNALLAMARGQYLQAIPSLSTLVEKYPADVDWLSRRALCRLLSGDPAGASDDIAAAMRLAPEEGELWLYRAMLGRLRFRNEEAKYDARHAVTLGLDPAYVDAMMELVK